ncbi:MAG: biopolymer transporter ExbD [Bacteroidaceae bacterium]|nr:biopolymer transporter ExbD [Bacteroidaceae bacterium]
MSKFSNKEKAEMPELNTSSLPDLIFSILFFFMIVTSMRQEELKLEYKAPRGNQLTKLERKTSGINVHVGESKEEPGNVMIQINDKIVKEDNVGMVGTHILDALNQMKNDDRVAMTVVLKVDAGDESSGRHGMTMKIVTDIKKALQDVNALRVMYSADEQKSKK